MGISHIHQMTLIKSLDAQNPDVGKGSPSSARLFHCIIT